MRTFGQEEGQNTAVILGANPSMSAVYANLYTEGFNLFLIGRKSDKKRVESMLRKLFGADVDAEVYDIEGQSISRVFYFPINDDEWNGESAQLLNLKALMSRVVNPSVTVMNHGYFDSTLQKSQDDVAKVFENTPYSIVTNLLGERLLEELDLMKDVDLGASRHRYEMEE